MTSKCKSCGRRVMLLCLVLLMSSLIGGEAGRINRSAFPENIYSEYVDPNNRTIWNMFNLTKEQVSRITVRDDGNASAKDETTQANNNQQINHTRAQRLNAIRSRIQSAISHKADENKDADSTGAQTRAMHEVAGYPMCNAEASAMAWQHSNNVSLQFASSTFERTGGNLHLESAILRLYKLIPRASGARDVTPISMLGNTDKHPANNCTEPVLESQIRITVSIVLQMKKKQRKKRTCNTMMLSSTKTGWVEIDIKCAINYWEQQQKQHKQQQSQSQHSQQPYIVLGLLMIEVHDDEENPLRPGQYFQPPTCEQADTAIPWGFYRSKAIMPSAEDIRMPRNPRLDIRSSGNGGFANILDIDSYKSSTEILKRHYLNQFNEHIFTEPSIANAPTVEHIHQHRRRHYQSQVTEPQIPDAEEFSNSNSGQVDSQQTQQRSRQQAQQQQHHHQHHHHHSHHQQHHQHHHQHHAE